MFLSVSGRHFGAHRIRMGYIQHGVSIQISINLGKTFLRISYLRKLVWPESWWGALHIYLLSISFIERFWFLFRYILNGVILQTSNSQWQSSTSGVTEVVFHCFSHYRRFNTWASLTAISRSPLRVDTGYRGAFRKATLYWGVLRSKTKQNQGFSHR